MMYPIVGDREEMNEKEELSDLRWEENDERRKSWIHVLRIVRREWMIQRRVSS
jgi:hypothetical protein